MDAHGLDDRLRAASAARARRGARGRGDRPADRRALPGRPYEPEVWLLGSSPQSAVWAAQLALPYAFADFINPKGAEIALSYREQAETPHTAVAVWAICADTDAEAERLASSIAMSMAMLRQNRPIPVPPPEKALRFLEQNPAPSGRRRIVGSPDTVRAGIESVAAEYRADEVIVVTITHDHGARRRSYELIADAFGLTDAHGLDDRLRAPAAG